MTDQPFKPSGIYNNIMRVSELREQLATVTARADRYERALKIIAVWADTGRVTHAAMQSIADKAMDALRGDPDAARRQYEDGRQAQ